MPEQLITQLIESEQIITQLMKIKEEIQTIFPEFRRHRNNVTHVNTIRHNNTSLALCQDSFIKNIAEKYAMQQQQRQSEISELQDKIKQLKQHMEDNVDYPELSESQMKVINDALALKKGDVALDEKTELRAKFGHTITRFDIRTLRKLEWLNDKVINFYMGLLNERAKLRSNDGYPKVYAMDSYFLPANCQLPTKIVINIFNHDIVIIPVHYNKDHWCLAIIDMRQKTIKYFDSLGSENNEVLSRLETFLVEQSNNTIDLSSWRKENVSDYPQQENQYDCGVFACMTAEFLSRNRPIVFNQENMEYFRNKMVLEICQGYLLT